MGAEEIHWTVKVCSSEAREVSIQAGPNNTDNDCFAYWHPEDGHKSFPLPARCQSLNRVYIRATTPGPFQTDLCLEYYGRCVKQMSFDGGDEDHDGVDANDDDDCPC
ncbi:MAG TPA: hypothetical protein VF534_06870 [Paraburkholderia sp.]